jgi:hypothetical protein
MSANPQPPRLPATGAPRTAAEIRRDIDIQREQLGTSVEALRGRVTELTDWRCQAASSSLTCKARFAPCVLAWRRLSLVRRW